HSWWRAVRGGDPDDGWAAYRQLVIRALAHADRVVAPSGAVLEAIAGCYPEAPLAPRARVIHNGVSARPFSGRAGTCRPGDAGPPLPGRFVLAAGRRWDDAKNLSLLEGIACRLPVPLVIAGPTRSPGGDDAGSA